MNYNDVLQQSSTTRLKAFQPTKWGNITLSIFPQEAIAWADDNLHRSNSKGDAFKKFTNLCVEWCSQQGVKPNWRSMYERQRLEKMPPFAPMIEHRSPKGEELQALPGLGCSASSPVGLSPKKRVFNCPCAYRKKFNPDYVCYGSRCPRR